MGKITDLICILGLRPPSLEPLVILLHGGSCRPPAHTPVTKSRNAHSYEVV